MGAGQLRLNEQSAGWPVKNLPNMQPGTLNSTENPGGLS
jgi:hypothetical protein